MRVLIFHGYMLRGTGSNIYNFNLARALARLGHEVHLLCQDREVRIEGVRIHNPDIRGLLPVYVKDPYEGFQVKAFPELTEAELDRYIEANVAAVREVAAAAGGIGAANGVLVGSGHTARSLWAALPDVPGLEAKTRLGPPGVDVDEFRPGGPDGEVPRTKTSPAG